MNRQRQGKGFRAKHFLLILLSTVALYYFKIYHPKSPIRSYPELASQETGKAYDGNGEIDYSSANGLCGRDLKTAMHKISRNHVILDFDVNSSAKYWWDNYFKKTDWHNGYYWDMYSNNKRSTYEGGEVQNREHCMPRSWWGTSKTYSSFDANGDLFNLFPADNEANSKKSNLALGQVGVATFYNGVVKVGKNTYPHAPYRGYIFEPGDQYKGDFARVYFYMVTCYEDYANCWHSDGLKTMLRKETYPVFQDWAINMLLEWSRQDPVDQKERDRNEAVFQIQKNRNPFVDFPDLAEYIWGENKTKPFNTKGIKVFHSS